MPCNLRATWAKRNKLNFIKTVITYPLQDGLGMADIFISEESPGCMGQRTG